MNRFSFFTVAALAVSQCAYAQDTLRIDQVWARSTPASSQNGAVYLTVRNQGQEGDRLLSARTPQAQQVRLHRSAVNNGVMQMREVEGGIVIEPGKTVSFAPGGLHLMLLGLTRPLRASTRFPLTLHFERAGDRQVEVEVRESPVTHAGSMHQHMN
jgi:copper(I)-binding protein